MLVKTRGESMCVDEGAIFGGIRGVEKGGGTIPSIGLLAPPPREWGYALIGAGKYYKPGDL